MTGVTDEADRLREQLEAERHARREAERVAEENARLLYERQDELELLEMVAAASNEATAIEPALGAAIVHVCAHTRWPVGHAYLAAADTGALQPTRVWYFEDEARLAAFRDASEDPELVTPGGLPGRVMASGDAAWIADVALDPDFPRAGLAAAAGLRSAFAFPILTGTRPVGVLEFFTDRPAAMDVALLSIMAQIGVQVGRVVERVRAGGELERSNADLEAFAYVASHDLAEPLRSVAGFVSLLERQYGDELDEQAREFIAYAVDGVERMQAMIEDLLLYARAGTADLRTERVAAGEVVQAALRDLDPTVMECGASIEVGELPDVRADPRQLQRVFQNLLANAIKYTAEGVTPRVRVSGRGADGFWELSVADNGIGIDPAQAERAFEMFARVPGGAGSYQGTGLGLAISRRIVERHGGRLWVEPNPGGGSVFRLTLPLP
jgi:signal transduction histidine kinase